MEMKIIAGELSENILFHRLAGEYLLRNEHWRMVNHFWDVRQGTKFGTWR